MKEASGAKDADIKVYQVPGTGSRVEYFVLGLEKASKRLVGVRALAVES